MSSRWTCKVVDAKATFLELKADAVQETLDQLGLQGWERVTARRIGTSARLHLEKEI